MSDAAFDAIASEYDVDFTHSIIGRLQRASVWRWLKKDLGSRTQLDILEINCGTGEDAIMLHRAGHKVVATDVSSEMIEQAQQKDENVDFRVCNFENLEGEFKADKFDIVFSNFAGLNCIDRAALEQLQKSIHNLLKPKGKFIVVMLGKYCWVERLYFRVKGKRDKVNRRLRKDSADLGNGAAQAVWCYSAAEIKQTFKRFNINFRRPIGLFIPPSYMESWAKKSPMLIRFLYGLELIFSSSSFFADRADHIYLSFTAK